MKIRLARKILKNKYDDVEFNRNLKYVRAFIKHSHNNNKFARKTGKLYLLIDTRKYFKNLFK